MAVLPEGSRNMSEEMNMNEIKEAAERAVTELLEVAKTEEGDIFVVGCSTSEVLGKHIGRGSSLEVAEALYAGIAPVVKKHGLYLAAQCCEHLNRAVIVEKAALLPGQEICNVVPQPHAGGSWATTVYGHMNHPVAVERIQAAAGMDIGDTLIGMHLRPVAVPVRLSFKTIGEANLVCARTRPKFIGGSRAVYDEKLSGGDIRR